MATDADYMAVTREEDPQNPSKLGTDDLFVAMRGWFSTDRSKSDEWREEARKSFDFVASDQWDQRTVKEMTDQKRPAITFNRELAIIKAVAGVEINTRQEIIYLPRGTEEGDVIANESLSAASEWMSDQCNAQAQESRAFQDMLICGLGFTESRIDYELHPDGKYVEQAISPLEMYWDHAAREQNLADRRRTWRARKMPLSDARALFPGEQDSDLNCSWVSDVGTSVPIAVEDRRLKLSPMTDRNDSKSTVVILQCQWWEREKYHRAVNPATGEMEEHDDASLKALKGQVDAANKAGEAESKQSGMPFQPLEVQSVTQYRRVYKQAFIGDKILKMGPCPRADGFTLNCITGERHETKNSWFGLEKLLRPAQQMANKWLSQATHIINTTAKGGILAEEDAFTDQRQAEATYAQPDAITWVKKNAISSNKIMQKPGIGMAAPYVQLLQLALDAMPQVTGINMELLGMRDVNQPGVLEAHRKQSAMTILATLFDSLTSYRIEIGRTRLFFIQNYLADGRLIRILGPDGYKAIRLVKDKAVGEYDVIVSEAPTSPNQKEQTWAALQSVLPAFQGMMTPDVAVMLLEYVPGLPQKLIDSLKGLLEQQQQSPEAAQQKQIAQQAELTKIDRDAAASEKDRALAKKTIAETVLGFASVASDNHLKEAQAAREESLAVHTKARAVKELAMTAVPEDPLFSNSDLPRLPQLPQVPMRRQPGPNPIAAPTIDDTPVQPPRGPSIAGINGAGV